MVDSPKEAEAVDIELADEQQILDELQGKTFQTEERWVYPIQGGHQLAYKAVKLACRMFAEHGEAIEVEAPADAKYDPKDPEYLLVQVKATRIKIDQKTGTRIILDSAIGAKRKWVKEKLKDNSVRADQFFFEKAVAQAERNAKMALLPQDFVKDFVAQILKNQKPGGRPAPKTAQSQKTSPPAAAPAQPKEEENKPPAEAPKQNGKSSELSALHQQFWAVLKWVTQKKDEAAGRQALKRLTGKEKVSELAESELKTLGGILRKVSKGECQISPDEGDKSRSIVIDFPTKEVVWPPGYKPPAKEEAPAAQAAPDAPDGKEWMF